MRTPMSFTKLLCAGVLVLPLLVAASSADAAACGTPVRYSASSNRIYVTAASVTLSDIARLCPSAPLRLVGTGTWLLSADLILDGGASLRLDGAPGGDVSVLLLASGSSGTVADVASITAQYGTISMSDVQVRSHDPATGGPDTSTAVPTGGVRGRAFIRAVSYMDGSVPKESRMDITRSDLGYLGYNGAEAYGVAYKARGCGATTPTVCDILSVRGNQVDSTFHHNFMGTYTWGAQDMQFLRNVYSDNVSYGLDPHDDSDYLVITGNRFSSNGNHGLICSQRCDHLTITDNVSRDNGITPYVGPGDDDPSDNQVHGIMLHRGVTDSLIANNVVTGQPTGAGIAIFDSVGNVVRDNTIQNNKYGIRLSVGSRDTAVSGNTVTGSTAYSLFSFKGSDAPTYTGTSGRPSDVTFTGNTFGSAGLETFKVQDSDRFTFSGGSAGGTSSRGPRFERGLGHVFDASVQIPAQLRFTLRGTSTQPTSVLFQGMQPSQVTLSADVYSTATFAP